MPPEPLTMAPGDVSKSSPKTPLPPANLRTHCQTTTRGCRITAARICPSGAPNPRLATIVVCPQSEVGRTPAMQAKATDTGAVRNQLRLRRRPQSATISDDAGTGSPGLQP